MKERTKGETTMKATKQGLFEYVTDKYGQGGPPDYLNWYESPAQFSEMMRDCGMGEIELRPVTQRDGSYTWVDSEGEIVLVEHEEMEGGAA